MGGVGGAGTSRAGQEESRSAGVLLSTGPAGQALEGGASEGEVGAASRAVLIPRAGEWLSRGVKLRVGRGGEGSAGWWGGMYDPALSSGWNRESLQGLKQRRATV